MKNVMMTALATVAVGAISMSVSADVLAYWNFNNDNLDVTQGAGTLTTNFEAANVLFFSGTTLNALNDDPSGSALSLQGGADLINNGAWVQFEIDTTGYQDLVLSFATRKTSTGFNNNQVSYSEDGGETWIDFGSPYDPPGGFVDPDSILSFDFSSVMGLNDNSTALFRITLDGATSSAGNNRIDNVQFNANQIPAPGALALLGLAGLVGARRRR